MSLAYRVNTTLAGASDQRAISKTGDLGEKAGREGHVCGVGGTTHTSSAGEQREVEN